MMTKSLLLLVFATILGEVLAGTAESCDKQKGCLEFNRTAVSGRCSGPCVYQVCAKLTYGGTCAKATTETFSHSCPKPEDQCSSRTNFTLPDKDSAPDGFSQCQYVTAGQSAQFLFKDARACNLGPALGPVTIGSVDGITCAPRLDDIKSCTGNAEGVECIWTVPTPATCPTPALTAFPSRKPSSTPSKLPSHKPSVKPSAEPSKLPSAIPSSDPSVYPSVNPSALPSISPSALPSVSPSNYPTALPSVSPSNYPTALPSVSPSTYPTALPSISPSMFPSSVPSSDPSEAPSTYPSAAPSKYPSAAPSKYPSAKPSSSPSAKPVTFKPTRHPVAPFSPVKPSAIDSCTKQQGCLEVTYRASKPPNACSSTCSYNICLTIWYGGACAKTSGTVSHTCVKNSTVCNALSAGFKNSNTKVQQGIGDGYTQCQLVAKGQQVQFLIKDGQTCANSAFNGMINGLATKCEPRPSTISSCTGNREFVECVWTVTAPNVCP